MKPKNKEFGHRLKIFRDYLGLKQAEFGERCGVIQKTISTMEAGNSSPNFENVRKVCEAFPMLNSDWLLFGRGQMLAGTSLNGKPTNQPYENTGIASDGQDKQEVKMSAKQAASESWEEIRAMYENVIRELRADKSFLQNHCEQLSKPSVA
jgi:transcriptional regulator with XRE-family HTH domain